MLIVVEHGYIAKLFKPRFYIEAAGSGNILEINTAEGAAYCGYDGNELVAVPGVYAYRECVHPAELLEYTALTLHYRHSGARAYVSEPQHGGSVGYNRDKIRPAGKQIILIWVGYDLTAGIGNARRIRKRKRIRGIDFHTGYNLYFSAPFIMLFKRLAHNGLTKYFLINLTGWYDSFEVRSPSFPSSSSRLIYLQSANAREASRNSIGYTPGTVRSAFST